MGVGTGAGMGYRDPPQLGHPKCPEVVAECERVRLSLLFASRWELGSRIGKGQYGEVCLAKAKRSSSGAENTSLYAVKILPKCPDDPSTAGSSTTKTTNSTMSQSTTSPWNSRSAVACKREIGIMRKLRHPNIVQLHDFFDEEDNIYIVMEYCRGGPLFKQIVNRSKYTEKDAREIFVYLLSALKYTHSMGIVHRDVKPDNILLINESSNDVKIADFGLSAAIDEGGHLLEFAGSFHWMAPEILENTSTPYGKPVDLWSLGVIAYNLLSGDYPFISKEQILRAEYYPMEGDSWESVSESAKDFIRKLLVVDPAQRMTADQASLHAWIAESVENELAEHNLAGSLKRFRKNINERLFKSAGKAVMLANRLVKKRGSSSSLLSSPDVATENKARSSTEHEPTTSTSGPGPALGELS